MNGMTGRQSDLLKFVESFTAEHNHAPSFQEVADALGLHSKGGILRMVRGLSERGLLEYLPNRQRSLRVLKADPYSAATLAGLSDGRLKMLLNTIDEVVEAKRPRPPEQPMTHGVHVYDPRA